MTIEQIKELSRLKAKIYLAKKNPSRYSRIIEIVKSMTYRKDWEEYNDFFHWTPPLEV